VGAGAERPAVDTTGTGEGLPRSEGVEAPRQVRLLHRISIVVSHLAIHRSVLLPHIVATTRGTRGKKVVQHGAEHRTDQSAKHRPNKGNRTQNLSQNRTHKTADETPHSWSFCPQRRIRLEGDSIAAKRPWRRKGSWETALIGMVRVNVHITIFPSNEKKI